MIENQPDYRGVGTAREAIRPRPSQALESILTIEVFFISHSKLNGCPFGTIGLRAAFLPIALVILVAGYTSAPRAGAVLKIDDTKWISLGLGLKTSFSAAEGQAGLNRNKWSTDFALNNLRLYVNGQIHEYFKFEFNTECANCSDGGDIRILDAVAKFEYNPFVNV